MSNPIDMDKLVQGPFPLKVIGKNEDDFKDFVLRIVSKHIKPPAEEEVEIRPSKDGNFLSVTVVLFPDSKAQLDAIYQELSEHKRVLMTL